MTLDQRLHTLLEQRKDKGTYRSLKEYSTVQTSSDRSNAESSKNALVDFSSNDYLSLTHSPRLREIYHRRLIEYRNPVFGSTGSRLLDGTTPAHSALERRLAKHFAFSPPSSSSPASPSSFNATPSAETSALLFNSGYDANVSFFSTIPQKGDYIVFDSLVHASVWDGLRSHSITRRAIKTLQFEHGSVEGLREVLRGIAEEQKVVVGKGKGKEREMIYIALESLYSMDGDLSPLLDIIEMLVKLKRSYPESINEGTVCVVLDEAHTTGVWGRGGRGYAWQCWEDESKKGKGKEQDVRVEDWVKVRVMTFGKGVGMQGAVLIASPTIRQFLINFARAFIFSTAMTVTNVLAIECAWDVLDSEEGDQRRKRLRSVCNHFRQDVKRSLSQHSIPTRLLALHDGPALPTSAEEADPPEVATYIVPLITPYPHDLATHLRSLGFLTRPIVHPTVPKGRERVRVCLHADNAKEDIDALVEGIIGWAGEKLTKQGSGMIKAKL